MTRGSASPTAPFLATFSPESSVILMETMAVSGLVDESAAYVLIDLSMTAIFTATEPPVLRPAGSEIPVGPLAAPNFWPARLAPLARAADDCTLLLTTVTGSSPSREPVSVRVRVRVKVRVSARARARVRAGVRARARGTFERGVAQ
eukprot:scaffold106916_cov45-Phaeocystis_antarctica.AAC.1